jgi:L-arabinokinase
MMIWSDVPSGKGVSSSAALEVGAMMALTGSYGVALPPEDLAAACQWVENHIVGAPCGIMDQMTCVLGKHDHLLRLRCQPAVVEGHIRIPEGYQFYGIDSGIRHAVSGADYGTVRTAAFMGYRILAEAAGLAASPEGRGVRIDDPIWQGYLANLSPETYERRYRDVLPTRMSGHDFLERYGGTTDPVTCVDPSRTYPVLNATRHPIYENARVERFADLLGRLAEDADATLEMGQLMEASHDSYNACGLGSEGTDRLVEMVRQAGPAHGLFGAKITGGGSGGTVALFGTRDAAPRVHALAECYAAESGRAADVFTGSSPGSAETDCLTIEP